MKDNRITQMVDDESPERDTARAIRARQRAIGRELRRMFDDVAQETIPQEFLDLLKEIDKNSPKKVS